MTTRRRHRHVEPDKQIRFPRPVPNVKLNVANIVIRDGKTTDAAAWESLRRKLWPDGASDHGPEIAAFFDGKHFKDLTAVLIAEDGTGGIVGFAELSIRDDVPTLRGVRTGYVEGLYVVPRARFLGVARKLLQASRTWARKQRCAAFASDRADRVVVDRTFANVGTEQ
jgi:aminoglycoside 6'-N-acetyltransferase I